MEIRFTVTTEVGHTQRAPSLLFFFNSLFWSNTAASGNSIYKLGTNCQVTVGYCLLQEGAIPATCTNDGYNIFAKDPLFIDATAGNYRLQANSPAINASNNNRIPAGITTDLDGNARIISGILLQESCDRAVDVSQLEQGIYLLVLELNGRAEVHKFVKK